MNLFYGITEMLRYYIIGAYKNVSTYMKPLKYNFFPTNRTEKMSVLCRKLSRAKN